MSRSYSYYSRLKGRPKRIKASNARPRQAPLRHLKVMTSEGAILPIRNASAACCGRADGGVLAPMRRLILR